MGDLHRRWNAYFDALDANGNGFLEPEDAALVVKELATRLKLSPEQVEALGKTQTTIYKALIASADKDNDGKVSRKEFLDLIDKQFKGKKYEEVPAWFRDNLESGAKFLDRDGDGILSLDEWLAANHTYPNHVSDADYTAAFHRAAGGNQMDLPTYHKAIHKWATSEEPVPDLETIFPFFKKH